MKPFTPDQHQAKKRFGQNFLHDYGVIERIVKCIQPKESDNIIEIGPGLGALTREILPHSKKIAVIELDRDVIPKLKFNCDRAGELTIYEQDALKTDFNQFSQAGIMRVVGNLPYNISTPILFHLFQFLPTIQDMHFMLQKEVVERIVAQPGSKTYGRLSVMTQYYCHAQMLFLVPPESFDPPPKVDSAIVRLKPREEKLAVADFELFSGLVSDAFNQRRKTIRNVWKKRISAQELVDVGLDAGARPENLALEDFIKVANYVASTR
ncbi:16S rRNA (adenine(1518)-N(6)/adenine(1519)-N(6))-dimethyltransferase RsmA [Aliikangiella coralliicola]|uniref:Ribosomal RNA small subunit methyltransferase A n=1 Tax=Aliikangiella coralliicola TaxID=2592383 RepID=A0A545UE19_9GAMM|nr:16S rRNA (adenine(1518)-N(6)/adenine(1519)-N(6))-dimethyltransferase RsmA [Aliikangiella coralliicola]TQV87717.1 16S rRNA (adenine(1518)-N(6)/adenine(1519)-N(6))-dimethyltransferase RsmA [Aliikangiella coralliicola]